MNISICIVIANCSIINSKRLIMFIDRKKPILEIWGIGFFTWEGSTQLWIIILTHNMLLSDKNTCVFIPFILIETMNQWFFAIYIYTFFDHLGTLSKIKFSDIADLFNEWSLFYTSLTVWLFYYWLSLKYAFNKHLDSFNYSNWNQSNDYITVHTTSLINHPIFNVVSAICNACNNALFSICMP